MGRIPNFTNSIFPSDSLPYLNLTATIGLVLFLFLTALEVDVRIVKRNAKSSTLISLAGIAIPFAMGAGIAVPIYRTFVDQKEKVDFNYFILFTAVAMSITAFPVLCRILTELKLLSTNVGVIVLSAGVGNDIVGWVLLALTWVNVAPSPLSVLTIPIELHWSMLLGDWLHFMYFSPPSHGPCSSYTQ